MEGKESDAAQSINEKPLKLLTLSRKMLIAYHFSFLGAIISALLP